jgi:hypothetical protein
MALVDTRSAQISPPPCGEGMGVGVTSRRTSMVFSPTAPFAPHSKRRRARVFTPPLTPPRQGEGDSPAGLA